MLWGEPHGIDCAYGSTVGRPRLLQKTCEEVKEVEANASVASVAAKAVAVFQNGGGHFHIKRQTIKQCKPFFSQQTPTSTSLPADSGRS